MLQVWKPNAQQLSNDKNFVMTMTNKSEDKTFMNIGKSAKLSQTELGI
jgi:hypothetical protein